MTSVLVVEDERILLAHVTRLLQRDGFDVEGAEEADQALHVLERRPVDVIVADILLRKSSGVDVLNGARAMLPTVRVILMTGLPTVDSAAAATRQGACDYLRKPVADDVLLNSVRRAARLKAEDDTTRRQEAQGRLRQAELEQTVTERTQALRQSNHSLHEAMVGVIHALAKAVEARDPYTAGHQCRVAALAFRIAGHLGLSDFRRKGLYLAGLVHDVGKIAIPAEILCKPGRLSPQEFELIKAHPRVGSEIFRGLSFPWPLAEAILQHHCRHDGTGYPEDLRLSGADILPEARILAVADVVEAMASHRPYRPALGIDAAIREILRGRGQAYCPAVVDACVEVTKAGDLWTADDSRLRGLRV